MTDGNGSTPDANVGGAADTSREGSTDTNKTVNNATDGKNSIDSTSNTQGRTGNRSRKYLRINPTVDTSNKAFKGYEPDIRCVLVLGFEKVDKKVAYDVFVKKMPTTLLGI